MRPGERFGIRMTVGSEPAPAGQDGTGLAQLWPMLLAVALGVLAGWVLPLLR